MEKIATKLSLFDKILFLNLFQLQGPAIHFNTEISKVS